MEKEGTTRREGIRKKKDIRIRRKERDREGIRRESRDLGFRRDSGVQEGVRRGTGKSAGKRGGGTCRRLEERA